MHLMLVDVYYVCSCHALFDFLIPAFQRMFQRPCKVMCRRQRWRKTHFSALHHQVSCIRLLHLLNIEMNHLYSVLFFLFLVQGSSSSTRPPTTKEISDDTTPIGISQPNTTLSIQSWFFYWEIKKIKKKVIVLTGFSTPKRGQHTVEFDSSNPEKGILTH